MTGSAIITALGARVRDSINTATARADLATILTHCQRAVNLHLRLRRASATLALAAGRTLYRTSEVAADVARIEQVYVLERTIPETAWPQLVNNRADWYRATDGTPSTWARLGSTLLAVTPAPWEPLSIEVLYVTTPVNIGDNATEIDTPEEHIPMLLDLAEGVTLLRGRQFAAMTAAMTRLAMMLPQRPGSGVPRHTVNV